MIVPTLFYVIILCAVFPASEHVRRMVMRHGYDFGRHEQVTRGAYRDGTPRSDASLNNREIDSWSVETVAETEAETEAVYC